MRGISEVIVIILMLMITVSMASMVYVFMTSMSDTTTTGASSYVSTMAKSPVKSFKVESIDLAKMYIRNLGEDPLTNLRIYVNDVPAVFNLTPSVIAAGQVGTVTIYSFLKENDEIKITSPSGYSSVKAVPDPCARAVGCWKFDEGTGTTAYDSSPFGNNGTLVNGPAWTTGRYGNGLQFDGANDYVNIPHHAGLEPSSITVEFWVNLNSDGTRHVIVTKWFGFTTEVNPDGTFKWGLYGLSNQYFGTKTISWNQWHYLVGTFDDSTKKQCIYIDGNLSECQTVTGSISYNQAALQVSWGYETNGTIDDIRIYNRAIY